MIKLVAATLAFGVVSIGALAADLPKRVPASTPVFASSMNWSGFYVGATAGYIINKFDIDHDNDRGKGQPIKNTTAEASIFGATLGWQRQSGSFVYGVETDFNFTPLKTNMYSRFVTASGPYLPGDPDGDWPITAETNSVVTLRARLGYVISPSTMLFVTGGVARKTTHLAILDSSDFEYTFKTWGWAAGAGFEYAVTNNISVKGEYLYLGFGKSYDISYINDGNDGDYFKPGNSHIIRAGINYRFGN
jgi:outer membrane immunogenic protein